MFAELLTSKYRGNTEGRGLTVDEWRVRQGEVTTIGWMDW
jgi:hypothetical protein